MERCDDQRGRSVSIGGDARGNAIQTGDNNVATVQFTQTTLPPPESVDIKAEFDELRQLLVKLRSTDGKKMERALADAHDELAKPEAKPDEIGDALERALKYAQTAKGFGDVLSELKPRIVRIVSVLGKNWHRLLSAVSQIV